MCLKTIDFFDVCGHNTNNDPNIAAYCDIQKCPDWDPVELKCPRLKTQDHHHNAKCPCCSERLKEVGLWYKHCYQAQVCDHEYDHMVTNLQRLSFEPDIVLVTPQPGVLCPDCKRAGYDNRPGGSNPAPRTASVMPVGFEKLPRAAMSQVQRVSQVPVTMLRSVSPSEARTSRIDSGAYNPGASRVSNQTISRATEYEGQAGSSLISQAPSGARSEFWSSTQVPSVHPGSSRVRNQSRVPPQSQVEGESSRAFKPRPSKLATVIQNSSSKAPSKAPTVTRTPSSTIPKPGAGIYSSATPTPHIYNHTKAPPADEEGPDLDEILAKASATISEPLSPPGGTGYPGVPSKYKPSVPRR